MVNSLNTSRVTLNQIIPISQEGYDFNSKAIESKRKLNEEFMKTPIKSNVSVVWIHNSIGAHAALSIDDRVFGYFFGNTTPEPKSLENYIKRETEKGEECSKAITVQPLKISPLQKRKIEESVNQEKFSCHTCMNAVSKILDQAEVFSVPSSINFSPEFSLAYIKNLKQKGSNELMEQKTFGKRKILDNQSLCYSGQMLFVAYVVSALATMLIRIPISSVNEEYNGLPSHAILISLILLTVWKIRSVVNSALN